MFWLENILTVFKIQLVLSGEAVDTEVVYECNVNYITLLRVVLQHIDKM